MSILPYGRIGDIGANSPFALQRAPQVQNPLETATKPASAASAEAARAAENAFSAAARPALRHETDTHMFLRQTDPRLLVRHMYRLGSLRGQHAAFDQVFWQNELAAQANELVEAARRVDGTVMSLADRRHHSPFRRYLALLAARERAPDAEGDLRVGQQIDQALDQAWAQHGPEILVGFNTASPLMRFAEQIEEWDHFRNLYASLVFNGEALGTTFRSLLKRFGAARLSRALKALRDAIAADLASPIVSADRTRLIECQRDLEGTHAISSMVAESDQLCRRLVGIDLKPEQVMEFVGGVFEFVAFTSYAEYRLNALCATVMPADQVTAKERAVVGNFLRVRVPVGLWANLAVRENLFPFIYRSRV